MQTLLPNDWQELLKEEFSKSYWPVLVEKVSDAYQLNTCYPPKDDIFNAFKYCAFKDVKVVIIGQDPYHGKGQANGLCFSYVGTQKFPPSLKNIYKEISNDLAVEMPKSFGDLTAWAKQGVLLLNATLTVQEGKPNSHQKFGWNSFTDAVIQKISKEKQEVVFLLWGGFAHKKEILIDEQKHKILKATHPSPLGANKGGWFGCKHFSKTNNYLKSLGKKEIKWKLIDNNQPPTLFTL
ncbi:uracil-DNA glycosylase [Wenyingzhuangia fucanilytica]|uniref:Uracil-DNA glycosylase n=1 Tax=Wenyingzhuangia fucanilytica TaxID=1790137 RepID=A0A1B1Y4C2_9FLAO|nr:uracil-DNA glycosylase [Wenyingzhuangia fucanilytica]ANW95626.1 uracil-DNA glycosylase [Wenyingzhuangia fucanilytica]